jgi:hypothetical protein
MGVLVTLDTAPVWLVGLLVAALLSGAGEVGYRIGSRRRDKDDAPALDQLVLAAAFTLVALLLGFTFSMGLERFEARRAMVVREASAIRTAALLADVLSPKDARAVREDLVRYAGARLSALGEPSGAARERGAAASEGAARDVWRAAMDASNRDPQSQRIPLLLTALNDTFDASESEDAALVAYVPKSVVVMLLLIAGLATMLLGFRFGRSGERELLANGMLIVMLTLAIGIVLDLGAPQRGIIQVSLEPLRAVQRSILP